MLCVILNFFALVTARHLNMSLNVKLKFSKFKYINIQSVFVSTTLNKTTVLTTLLKPITIIKKNPKIKKKVQTK